jgi:hypothetical protein
MTSANVAPKRRTRTKAAARKIKAGAHRNAQHSRRNRLQIFLSLIKIALLLPFGIGVVCAKRRLYEN